MYSISETGLHAFVEKFVSVLIVVEKMYTASKNVIIS